MKKLIFNVMLVLLIAAFTASLCTGAFAAGGTDCVDEDLNVTFTVPDGWTRNKEKEVDGTLYYFTREGDDGTAYFSYSTLDVFGTMEADTSKVKREDFGNDIFTVDYFSDAIKESYENSGFTVNSCVAEKYKISDSYYFKVNADLSAKGTTMTLVQLCHIYNGYAFYFTFIFTGKEADEAVVDTIMKTVGFADEKGSNKVKTDAEKTGETVVKGIGSGLMRGLIRGGIAAVTVLVVGAIVRAVKKKKNQKADQDQTYIPPQE